MSQSNEKHGLWFLWRQFLPLSVSDLTMAFADPAITTTLTHMPDARTNLAAVGAAKSLAIFFESPIIMILHASNTLGASRDSRAALKKFTLFAMLILTAIMGFIALPPVFGFVARNFLELPEEVGIRAGKVLLVLSIWPSAIAWRRFYQGLLIRYGHGHTVAVAGIGRLVIVACILVAGFLLHTDGALLAAVALAGGVLGEAVLVTLAARYYGVEQADNLPTKSSRPSTMKGIWRFYWPLATSLLIIWGGRAVLIGIIARAHDSLLALAAWPAAWGIIHLIGNWTRMIQQVIIRNLDLVSPQLLRRFTLSVGVTASLILFALSSTPLGEATIRTFLGGDLALLERVLPVLRVSILVPLVIAVQNAVQGTFISRELTSRINTATLLATALLLIFSSIFVALGMPGALSAGIAMFIAYASESVWLGIGLKKSPH